MSPVSTATDTLQPNSPWISEDPPPKTTSTAPPYGYPTEEVMKSDPDLTRRIQSIHEAQPFQSPTLSQQSDLSDNLLVRIQDSEFHLATVLDKFAALQEDISVQRSHARNFRNALRHKREQEDHTRLALRDCLASIKPEELHAGALRINEAIEDLQAATASYLGLETEYQQVEDALEQKEQHLNKYTADIVSILRNEATFLAQEQRDTSIDVDPDSPVHHIVPTEGTRDLSPKAAEYVSLVEDATIIRTRLDELTHGEMEYMRIIDQQKFRGQNGLPLDNNAQLFLEQYEDERNGIEEELNPTHLRLENHPGRKMPHENTVTDDEWRDLLKEYLPDQPNDQSPPDPLRASELDDRSPFFETARPLPLNKSNFVNHWLLYRLRHSAIEVLQFKSQPELVDLMEQGWDGDSISQMAMRLWYEDGTTKIEMAE